MNLLVQTVSALGGYRGQIFLVSQGPDILNRDGQTSKIVVWETAVWDDATGALEEARGKLRDVLTGLFG